MDVGVGTLLGPIFIGSLIAYLLIGAYGVQLFRYLTEDTIAYARVQLHVLVILVTVVELVNIVFITQNSWRALVSAVQNPEYRTVAPATAPGIAILNGLVSALVQCFFAWRIFRLTRKRPHPSARLAVPGTIVALALLQMAAGFVVAAHLVRVHLERSQVERLRTGVLLNLSGSLACDTLISISIIYILLDFKATVGLCSTSRMLNSLIVNAVENGAVLTICVALNLAFYVTRAHDFIHLSLQFVVGGLYANVLLASLNGRGRRDGKELSKDRSAGEEPDTFRDLEIESRGMLATNTSPLTRTTLYRLTAPKLRSHVDDDNGHSPILRLTRQRSDRNTVKTPPPAFVVSTVTTEVHRDGEGSVGRPPLRYASDSQTLGKRSGSSSGHGHD